MQMRQVPPRTRRLVTASYFILRVRLTCISVTSLLVDDDGCDCKVQSYILAIIVMANLFRVLFQWAMEYVVTVIPTVSGLA